MQNVNIHTYRWSIKVNFKQFQKEDYYCVNGDWCFYPKIDLDENDYYIYKYFCNDKLIGC